jgi:hypothetical protein
MTNQMSTLVKMVCQATRRRLFCWAQDTVDPGIHQRTMKADPNLRVLCIYLVKYKQMTLNCQALCEVHITRYAWARVLPPVLHPFLSTLIATEPPAASKIA